MFDRLINNIEFYLNPFNLIKAIINFMLRKDILQIAIFYSASKYIMTNGFFDEQLAQYLSGFYVSFDVLGNFVYNAIGFNIDANAFFLLIAAILLESYSDRLPSSIAHSMREIACPVLVFVSLWAMSGNIIFALIVAILKHISGKGYHLDFLAASNSSVYYL